MRHLGITIREREAGPYRDASGKQLEGEWLGGFAQPGVVLHKATAVSARFDEREGAMVDEYGPSSVYILRRHEDRIWLTKQYGRQQFTYVGQLGDGTLAGYWYSPLVPTFEGVFWFARADRLDDATRAELQRRVRSSSPRKWIAVVGIPVVSFAPVVAYPHAAGMMATFAICWTMMGLGFARKRRLLREAALWREELK